MVEAADGCLAVAVGQDQFDLIRRKESRDRGLGPVGNCRNRGCQVQLYIAAISRILEEATQCSRHDLSPLGMEANGLALDKSNDVYRAENREIHFSISEPVLQKTTDELQIEGYCCLREGTLLSQVRAELICQEFSGCLHSWRLFLWHDTLLTKEVQEPLESKSIAFSDATLLRPLLQIALNAFWSKVIYG